MNSQRLAVDLILDLEMALDSFLLGLEFAE